jgi:hypothetical protein
MPHTCSQHGISLACHRMIAWAHEVDSGCEAMPSHVRFSVRHASHVQPAWNLLGLPSDDRSGACGGFRVRGDAIARAIWRFAIHPSPSVIPCRLPWQPQRGISWACHRMIARAHAADSGCEAMPSHVRFSARHASHMRTASPLACHRTIAWAHAVDSGCEAMPSHVRLSSARGPFSIFNFQFPH